MARPGGFEPSTLGSEDKAVKTEQKNLAFQPAVGFIGGVCQAPAAEDKDEAKEGINYQCPSRSACSYNEGKISHNASKAG